MASSTEKPKSEAPRRQRGKLIAIVVVILVVVAAVGVILGTRNVRKANVITYVTNSEMVTLDPSSEFSNSIILLPNVYETLTHWDPTKQKAVPLLATDWNASSDGLDWTFQLRQDVKFHDDTPFNATAVKFSLLRTITIGQGAAYIWAPLGNATQAAENIEILDTYTIHFHLLYPAPFDKIATCGYAAYIFSPNTPGANYTLQQEWFDAGHESGSGPYMLDTTVQYSNSYVVLKKFAGYWGGWKSGQFDNAIIKTIADPAQREQAVLSGTADILVDPPLQYVPTLQNNSAVNVVKNPSYRALYVFFNMERSPTSNTTVRRALAHSIPYDDIMTSVMSGLGTQSIGMIPATMWGHDDTLPYYDFNLSMAEQLLTEAGYPDGGFTLKYTYLQGDLYEQKVAELWKEQLTTLGINLDIQPMPWEEQWLLATANPATAQDIFVMYWWPGYVTPYDFLYNMFSSYSYAYFNLGYYNNSAFDSVIDSAAALEATNPTQALADYRIAQLMLYNDCPGVGIVDIENLYVLKANLQGFSDNPAYPLVVFFYQLHH